MADPKKVIRQRQAPYETLVYPLDLQSPGRNNYIQFTLTYNDQNKFLGAGTKTQTIALYLPKGSLKTSYGQNYSELAGGQLLNFFGEGANKILSDAVDRAKTGGVQAGVTDGIKNFIQELSPFDESGHISTSSQLAENLEKIAAAGAAPTIAATVGGLITGNPVLSGVLGGASATDFVSGLTGYAINPHVSIIYKGPSSFRTHDFVFQFFPRSSGEAKEVAKIVASFKKMMLPRKTSGLDLNSTFLKHPGFVELKLVVNGEVFDKFAIRKSVVTGLSLDYESEGGPSFFTETFGKNEPTQTTMGLSFKEVDFLYVDEENTLSEFDGEVDDETNYLLEKHDEYQATA